jgi:predicted DsbA family dithiol-disulfide isomerase
VEPGLHELTRARTDVEVVWKAFELRPDPAPSLDPAGEYLTRVWRDSVYPLAERLGVTMRLPPIQPRSRRAHEAAKWAQTQSLNANQYDGHNQFGVYNEAVFRAFFERGEDIGNVDVLVKLARDLQLNGSSLRAALDTKQFEPSVLADEHEAAELGLNAVPAFVANRRFALSGVQPVAALEELVNRASAFDPNGRDREV